MSWQIKFKHTEGAIFDVDAAFNEGLADEFHFPASVNFDAADSVNDFIARTLKAHALATAVDDTEVKYAEVFLKLTAELDAGTPKTPKTGKV